MSDLIERLTAQGALFWNGDKDERIAGMLMHEAAAALKAQRAEALPSGMALLAQDSPTIGEALLEIIDRLQRHDYAGDDGMEYRSDGDYLDYGDVVAAIKRLSMNNDASKEEK